MILSPHIRVDGAAFCPIDSEPNAAKGLSLRVRGVSYVCKDLRVAVRVGSFCKDISVSAEGGTWTASFKLGPRDAQDVGVGKPLRLFVQSLANVTDVVLVPGTVAAGGTVVPGGGTVAPDPCSIQVTTVRRTTSAGATTVEVVGHASACSGLLVTMNAEGGSQTAGVTVNGGSWRATMGTIEVECGEPVVILAQCGTDPTCVARVTAQVECADEGGGGPKTGLRPGVAIMDPSVGLAADAGVPVAPGTLGALTQRLRSAGLSWDALLAPLAMASADAAGGFLQYLRAAAARPTPNALAFYLAFARNIFPYDQFARWATLMDELFGPARLSAESQAFVAEEGLATRLWAQLVRMTGVEPIAPLAKRPSEVAFLRCILRCLEDWPRLAAEDPNLPHLIHILNRYGSLAEYYRCDPVARRALQRLIEAGYEVDHLVFGETDLLMDGEGLSKDDIGAWPDQLKALAHRIIGGRSGKPAHNLPVDPQRLFQTIRKDFEAMQSRQDPSMGLRVIDGLLPALVERQTQLYRTGALVSEIRLNEDIYQLRRLRAQLSGEAPAHEESRVRAIRSAKHVPELLFDNERLACCLFKPAGLFHTEISRLLLDPATPLIEFWLDPHPEFLGLATMYPGVNARGERTVLMDTIDYSDTLLDLHGYNPTMQLILTAMAKDAHLSRAQKLLIFAAPYGKPVNFANYMRRMQGRYHSITYHEGYYFESVDPTDSALARSTTGRHHYTTALGFNRPMRGTIDFGFNLVAPGRVDKLPNGGQGVFEIDVAAFLAEIDVPTTKNMRPDATPSLREVHAVHARPHHHEDEIERRRDRILHDVCARRSSPVVIERVTTLDDKTLATLVDTDHAAFGAHFRYGADSFRERWQRKGSVFLIARHNGRAIGQAVAYAAMGEGGQDVFFVDEVAVHPLRQRSGTGTVLLEAMVDLGRLHGFDEIVLLTDHQALAQTGHHAFYSRAGFWPVGLPAAQGQRYARRVSLHDDTPAMRETLNGLQEELGAALAQARISVVTEHDDETLALMVAFERQFPPHLRYTLEEFRQRLKQPDASVILFWEGERPAAFGLSYHIPRPDMAFSALPRHAFFLDTMAVRPDCQSRGLGRLLFKALTTLPAHGPYTTAVFYCQAEAGPPGNLVDYYRRLGAQVIDVSHDFATMLVPVTTGPISVVADDKAEDSGHAS